MKIYLDTSVISALFDDRNPERKSLTEAFFMKLSEYDVYISEITILEIERTPDPELVDKMRAVIHQFSVISLNDDIERLAKEYISQNVIPEGYSEDAYHIAIAVLYEMDYLLSWNFRHIVRKKAKDSIKQSMK